MSVSGGQEGTLKTVGSDVDLDLLFQEAERSVNQIIQTKREKDGQPAPEPAAAREPPDQQARATPSSSAEIDAMKVKLDTIQEHNRQLEFEFRNYRERVGRLQTQNEAAARAELLKTFLEILDILEFAKSTFGGKTPHSIGSYQRGYILLHKKLADILESIGLHKIEAEGRPFDPAVHQAVTAEETAAVKSQTVVQEMKTGYLFGDILLRPAMVKVAIPPKRDAPGETGGAS